MAFGTVGERRRRTPQQRTPSRHSLAGSASVVSEHISSSGEAKGQKKVAPNGPRPIRWWGFEVGDPR